MSGFAREAIRFTHVLSFVTLAFLAASCSQQPGPSSAASRAIGVRSTSGGLVIDLAEQSPTSSSAEVNKLGSAICPAPIHVVCVVHFPLCLAERSARTR